MKKLFLFSTTLLLISFGNPALLVQQNDMAISHQGMEGIGVGDKAPNFNLKNIDGKEYSFDNITDANSNKPKGYIVVFTCMPQRGIL